MDARNRFERRSLRDVLVAQSVLTSEEADELMSSAREHNESFGAVVVEAGNLTEWDLAKLVSTHYQMPYLPLEGYRWDRELAAGLPASTLYQYLVLPVGKFGKVRTFGVVEPPTRECLGSLQDACGSHLFFFVALVKEVKRLLQENVKVVDTSADPSWQAIFDQADQNVSDGEEDVV